MRKMCSFYMNRNDKLLYSNANIVLSYRISNLYFQTCLFERAHQNRANMYVWIQVCNQLHRDSNVRKTQPKTLNLQNSCSYGALQQIIKISSISTAYSCRIHCLFDTRRHVPVFDTCYSDVIVMVNCTWHTKTFMTKGLVFIMTYS